MISFQPTSPSSPAAGSRSYVRWDDRSLDDLGQDLAQLKSGGQQDSVQLGAAPDGRLVPHQEDGSDYAVPVTLGQLSKALDEIERRDDWMTDRDGVSLYEDRNGAVHLDVINFGGFLLKDDGGIASRSVNPW